MTALAHSYFKEDHLFMHAGENTVHIHDWDGWAICSGPLFVSL